MQMLRRALILTHRYLGIPLSVLFVLWFVTGIAMIYVGGMPTLSTQARLERLPTLDVAAVRVTPAEAAERAASGFGRVALTTVLRRPAYRFASPYGAATVFADTGEPLDEIDVDTARGVAARFAGAPENAVELVRTVERPDQWTLQLGRDLPLYKFAVSDGAGTEVYVSPSLGEVRLVTTTKARTLAWIATIPHWFYITPLRTNQPAWYWTVVVTSALGCVLALLGLVLGITQFNKSKPFRWSNAVRYQGWMRWHYISGVFFGIFALTWVFSGLLSMEPFDWANADEGLDIRGDALTGGPVELERFPPFAAEPWSALLTGRTLKELEFRRIDDAPYYLARYTGTSAEPDPHRERLHQPYPILGSAEPQHMLVDARTLTARTDPFPTDTLLARLRAAAPDASIVTHELLDNYDAYYYSRNRQAVLPVLRVKFDDPLETWVYIDPELGQIVASIHRLHRVERWLYNGLHSLDFGFWYDRRPLWDIGMILLSLGALVTSTIGFWLGWKRLKRDLA
jgi:PepSY-associated TM region